MLILFFLAVVALSVATSLDVLWTNRGIKIGAFVEGNKIMDWLYKTDKPTLLQLWAYNIGTTIAVVAPSFIGLVLGNTVLTIGGLGAIVGNAVHHYQSFRKCVAFMKH